MKILHHKDLTPTEFDGDTVKGVAGRVLIGRDDGAKHFCMRLFEVSPGGHSPRHAHEWEHEIFVHAGRGAVFRNGQWDDVEPGHSIFIPGNEDHQLKNTGDEPFVFVCLIPAGAPEL